MEPSADNHRNESVQMFIRAHDDLFQKQLISEGGDLYVTPVESCSCEFEFELIQGPENVFKSNFPQSPLILGFHPNLLTYFISRALQSMNISEKARFSFQYESELLTVDIRLISFDKKDDLYLWPTEEKQNFCIALKNFGNELFKEKRFVWAFHHYQRALLFFSCSSDDVQDKVKDLKSQLVMNIALCQSSIRGDELSKPILNLSLVLRYEPNNIKALYRRGKHYLMVNDFEKAEVDLEKAYALDPTNTAVIEQKQILKRKKQKNDDATANAMSRFFSAS